MQKIGMVAMDGACQGLSPFFLTPSLRGPCTHAGSSPEGDTALDEEHGHVSAAHQKQDTTEAQMDEANEDLHGLQGSARQLAQPAAYCPGTQAAAIHKIILSSKTSPPL